MTKNWIAVAALLLTVGATGCKKKTPENTGDATPAGEKTAPVASGEEARTGLPAPDTERLMLGTIYFELDAHTLTPDAKSTLAKNAEALIGNANVTVRVEGHADERGSTQYNLALGQRRANAVKDYLSTLGVAVSRMEVVSFGEEKPADMGHDESAWSKNRRVELAVTGGADRVSSSY